MIPFLDPQEADLLGDRIIIMARGRVAAAGSSMELKVRGLASACVSYTAQPHCQIIVSARCLEGLEPM